MIEKVLTPRYIKNVNAPLTQVQYDALEEYSKKNNLHKSDVLRHALTVFLKENTNG